VLVYFSFLLSVYTGPSRLSMDNIKTWTGLSMEESVADPGGGGPAPYFGKVNFIFTLYTMFGKIFLKLNLDFIGLVAEIRGVFGRMGVYACVCVNRNRGRYCFSFCKGPILNNIRGHSDPPKNMPDCIKLHLIF